MSWHVEPDMDIRQCISKVVEEYQEHPTRYQKMGLLIRVAQSDDGEDVYASLTEHGNYLDETIAYLNPERALEEWDNLSM